MRVKQRQFNSMNILLKDAQYFQIPFGTHKDKMLKDIPNEYLRWVQMGTEIPNIGNNIDAYLGRHPDKNYFDQDKYLDKLLKRDDKKTLDMNP